MLTCKSIQQEPKTAECSYNCAKERSKVSVHFVKCCSSCLCISCCAVFDLGVRLGPHTASVFIFVIFRVYLVIHFFTLLLKVFLDTFPRPALSVYYYSDLFFLFSGSPLPSSLTTTLFLVFPARSKDLARIYIVFLLFFLC